jgi:hypothetical protein
MMADYNSQLPVRSKDDSDERLLTKIQDGSDPSGVGKTVEVSETKLHTRNHGSDSDGTDREVLLSQEGHVQSNGDYDASTNKRPSSQGMIVSDRDASPAESTMNKRPTAVAGDSDKVALDVAISDSSGNNFTDTNPLPVYIADNPAVEVDDFDQASAVAKDASSNHDYTITSGKTGKHLTADASASGYARFELQVETGVGAGTFDTKMVKFNSTAKPNVEFRLRANIGAGIIVRIAKTNLDNQPQDLYSQISLVEVS